MREIGGSTFWWRCGKQSPTGDLIRRENTCGKLWGSLMQDFPFGICPAVRSLCCAGPRVRSMELFITERCITRGN